MPMRSSEPDCVEDAFQYRAVRARIAALDRHLKAIADLQDLARDHRTTLTIEDDDLRDLAPLEDAASDITWTRDGLLRAAGAWEDRAAYGTPHAELAPVVSVSGMKG